MQPSHDARVFIVDDDGGVRDGLAWLLRSRHLPSRCFDSAESFDAMLHGGLPRAQPCCLLLDVRMPGMSGLALFESLAERGLTLWIPVIFLTGHADLPTAVAMVKRGAFDFCEKPVSDNALVDRVEQAIAHSAQQLALVDRRASVTRRLAELIEQIAHTTQSEAELANDVAGNIQHIFAVTEQTGESTRTTAQQVRDLAHMAEELRQSVARFKID
jgi:two-component system response regulator DctR